MVPGDGKNFVLPVSDAARVEPVQTWPGQTQMAELQKLLWAAKQPIMIVGGSGWSEKAAESLRRFAERFDLPVVTSSRRAMLFAGDHPNYAGELAIGPNPKLRARIEAADGLQAEKALVINVPHDEAEFVYMGGEHDARPAAALFKTDDAAHRVQGDVIHQRAHFFGHQRAHLFFAAGDARGFAQAFQ